MLRDSQATLATERSSIPIHSHLHELKIQLEDIEAAKTNAIKERNIIENELNDLKCQVDFQTFMLEINFFFSLKF